MTMPSPLSFFGAAAVIIIVLEIGRFFFTDDLCQSNSHFVGLRF
jgi:hypothetical protein